MSEKVEVNPGGIPETLRGHQAWICWRTQCRDCWTVAEYGTDECPECGSEPSKVPVNPRTGDMASSTDADTWASLSDALEYHSRGATDTDGIGYVFDEDSVLVGVDLDDVRDPATGEIEPWAMEVVDELDSFTEVSVSGTGLHIYAVGIKPGDACKENGLPSTLDRFDGSELEMYDSARYFALTGEQLPGTRDDVEQRAGAVKAVYQEHLGDETDPQQDTLADATPKEPTDLDDADLVEKAKNAKNGDTFARLWRGDTSGHSGDHSAARMALLCHLAFWTGCDRQQMDRLFQDSGLYPHPEKPGKWERVGEDEIRKAIRQTTEVYEPSKSADVSAAKATDGGATTDSPTGSTEATEWPLAPTTVAREASLGEDGSISDLSDRVKAAKVWEIIGRTNEVHVCVRRDTDAIWAYDGGVWRRDGERALRHAARKALGAENYGSNVLNELKAQARSDPTAEVEQDRFGVDPGTLAVANGLLDLEKAARGEADALRPLKPADYALTQLPVEYDPDAKADEWRKFVDEVVESGREKAIQEYVGYCLHVNAMPIHRALMLVGTGANGKSVFLGVVREMLGTEAPHDNTSATELQTLANERDAVASFHGKLANIDDDLSARKLGNGLGMFRKLTGDNRVEGRHLYEERFKYHATGKHLYAANEVPDVSEEVADEDEWFWRRWLIVEFPNHYPPSKRDPELGDRLTTDDTLRGVLNWAIEGWQRLMENGRFTGEETGGFEKRERWQAWGDSLDKFVSEHVDRDEDLGTDERLTTSQAYQRYEAWCRTNDLQPMGQRQLTDRLKSEGVGYDTSVRIDGTVQRGYKHLRLSQDVPDLNESTARRGRQTGLGDN